VTTTQAPKEATRSDRVAATNVEGIWGEVTSSDEGLQQVVFQRPLPMQLISSYVEIAVRHANVVQDDGQWLATIEEFPGVWAKEASQKEALDVLGEVVFEWVLLKIHDEDRDLPVLESLDLNSL
jgi:predicted RNase H-like HicB family nuclease